MKSIMVDKWIKETRFILKSTYPNASDKTINDYISNLLKKYYKNEEVKCYNNYDNYVKKSTCADIENFYYSDYKPIATEHGTFFRPDVESPAVLMLTEEKKERKELKRLRDMSDKDSYEYEKYDRNQGLRKIAMNSYYGASGSPSFIFYNIHCATATTGKVLPLILVII